jgi:hypothetical protein
VDEQVFDASGGWLALMPEILTSREGGDKNKRGLKKIRRSSIMGDADDAITENALKL